MPYNRQLTPQRAIYITDELWERFKAACKRAGVPMQHVLHKFVAQVASGRIKVESSIELIRSDIDS